MRKLLTIGCLLAAATVGVSVFAQAKTIAVVDTQQVFAQSKEGKKVQDELNAFKTQKQAEINAKQAALKALEEKIKDPKYSDDKKQEWKDQFNQKMYEYQAMAKSAQDEWNNRKQRLQQKFAEEAQSVITAYAKTKGYSIILEKQICLYNADALDITNEVIRAMNAKYPGTGSGGAKN